MGGDILTVGTRIMFVEPLQVSLNMGVGGDGIDFESKHLP